jgi:hypothetical protein
MTSHARRFFGRFVAWLASLDANLEVNRVNTRWPVSDGKWCDYCSCYQCQTGGNDPPPDPRVECLDGTHICSVCLREEPCVDNVAPLGSGPKRGKGSFFCREHPFCVHKPKLKVPPPDRTRPVSREEALASLFGLAGGWGSEDDQKVLCYIEQLEKQLSR